ncbi:MAG: PEP-CTERM sorting domain-containing protein [Planctomycetota bacterium]|jgi:hypothetical protein
MKKLLVLSVVLLILTGVSVASAGTAWFEVDPSDAKDSYGPSETITIRVVADATVSQLTLGAITSDSGGQATGPLTLHYNFDLLPSVGSLVNGGTPFVLVELITGHVYTGSPLVPPGEALYSFEYQIPMVGSPATITIDDYTDAAHTPPYTTTVRFGDATTVQDIGMLELNVVPEPATLVLLATGGLLLRRRR